MDDIARETLALSSLPVSRFLINAEALLHYYVVELTQVKAADNSKVTTV